MRGIVRSPDQRALGLLVAIPLLISAVLGVGIQIQPDTIQEGSQISIALSNVTDGSTLNTITASTFPATSSTSWYNITNWRYSFSLQKGNITVVGGNVNRMTLLVRAGSVTNGAPPKPGMGDITISLPMDILTGVYYDYRILYEVHNASAPVTITLIHEGSKLGIDDSVSTPFIYGAGGGIMTVEILLNGTLAGDKEIRIQKELPLPTPTVGNTTVTLSPTSTRPATTLPVTTRPASVPSPSASPPVTPSPPPPSPEALSPYIIVYAGVIFIIAILADYIIMKD